MMARRSAYDEATRQRIRMMKGQHSAARCAAVLREGGVKISERSVRSIWDEVLPSAPGAPPPDEPTVGDEDTAVILRAMIREGRTDSRLAKREQRGADQKKADEGVLKCIALLDKITPPRPPDPNDNPDVRVSAEKCIAKLHDLLDRRLAQ